MKTFDNSLYIWRDISLAQISFRMASRLKGLKVMGCLISQKYLFNSAVIFPILSNLSKQEDPTLIRHSTRYRVSKVVYRSSLCLGQDVCYDTRTEYFPRLNRAQVLNWGKGRRPQLVFPSDTTSARIHVVSSFSL